MAFARTETTILNHPKFLGLDPAALGLWTLGNAYCWDQLTDGFIPDDQLPRLLNWVRPSRVSSLASILVRHGLWERIEPGRSPERSPEQALETRKQLARTGALACGFLVHDWLDHNPPAAKIKADRLAAQTRMKERRRSQRSSERTGERTAEPHHGSPVRSAVRSRQDVDVDVDSPPKVPQNIDPAIPFAQRTDRRVWTADGYPRIAYRTDCPDEAWRLRCVSPTFLEAHPEWRGKLPDGPRGTCPEHRAKAAYPWP